MARCHRYRALSLYRMRDPSLLPTGDLSFHGGTLRRLADAVRSRRVSAAELVETALRRIEAARHLNAVVRLRGEEAMAEARAVDGAIQRGDPVGPLAGLPLLVKDIEDVAGLPTTFGSLLHRNDPPAQRDGIVPRRLRAAGAIVVGKTNVPEFAFEGYTANRLFGATRNPWAPEWSPGGSSGGSAAALAAGLAPLATATDGGGSIRIPAALCGLVGLKPTNGVIGRDPIPDWIDLSTDGPLATSVADVALLLSLEAGPVAGDPTAQVGWRLGEPSRPRRIYAASRLAGPDPIAPEVEDAFRRALQEVEEHLGLPVQPLPSGSVFPSGYDPRDWFRLAATEQLHALGQKVLAEQRDLLDPTFAAWMDQAAAVTLEEYLAARRRRFRHVRELDELLGDDAVLLSPVLTVEGWTPDGVLPGRERPGLPSWVFNTEPLNVTGHPALSLPAGRLAGTGLPFGLQVVGPRYREDLVLGFAAAWEAARPWPVVAPGYEPFDL